MENFNGVKTPEPKRFLVTLLCSNRVYGRWMASGIITSRENSRGRFQHTPDRTQAMTFSKFVALDLAATLNAKYGVRAAVEYADAIPGKREFVNA